MEARSEPGAMATGESSDAKIIQRNPVQPHPPVYSMRLVSSSDGTAMYKSTSGNSPPPEYGGGGGGGDGNSVASGSHGLGVSTREPFKRKRGRPRKYGFNGTVVVPLTTVSPIPTASALPLKKGRGRPPGSRKKQQMVALGSAGIGLTPHIIAIKTGEDIASKIMAFSQQGLHAVCILSANGAVSNVTLHQAAISGGTVTYEGRFEILSLSGSFMLSEYGGQRSGTGGLSVCLAGPDGCVLGGGVAGILTAASPVQVVVCSFIADGKNATSEMNPSEPVCDPGKLVGPVGVSQGTLSESYDGPGSSLNRNIGACNNGSQQGMPNMP